MSGRWRTVSRSAFPGNRPRASTSAASTPNGKLQSTAQAATRRLSRIAWTSSGLSDPRASTMLVPRRPAYLRTVNPCFSQAGRAPGARM